MNCTFLTKRIGFFFIIKHLQHAQRQVKRCFIKCYRVFKKLPKCASEMCYFRYLL